MGYYTDYRLSSDNTPLEVFEEDIRALSGYDSSWDNDGDELSLCDVKWYDHDKHMIELSKKHPTVQFVLHGNGEESGDIWVSYYMNGQSQHEKAEFNPAPPTIFGEPEVATPEPDPIDSLVTMLGDCDEKRDYFVLLVAGDVRYYINHLHFSAWLAKRVHEIERGYPCVLNNMMHAEFAYNMATNEVLKCRGMLDDVISGRYSRPILTITLKEGT